MTTPTAEQRAVFYEILAKAFDTCIDLAERQAGVYQSVASQLPPGDKMMLIFKIKAEAITELARSIETVKAAVTEDDPLLQKPRTH